MKLNFYISDSTADPTTMGIQISLRDIFLMMVWINIETLPNTTKYIFYSFISHLLTSL